MIEKLTGREKVVWNAVANKVNEIIDLLNANEQKEVEEKQSE